MAYTLRSVSSAVSSTRASRFSTVAVRASAQINPSIRKSEEKVADFVKASIVVGNAWPTLR